MSLQFTRTRDEMDGIYKSIPLEEIPWNIETTPDALVELVETGELKPCKAVDLGCGAGNYAIYLAGKGFDVTGIDISPEAIKIAVENSRKKNADVNFLAADLLGDLNEVTESFDFAYDWEVLHHIYPDKRKRYVENVYKILNAGGEYLSVCFSDKSPQFGGKGKYRDTPLGTRLYFSSEDELHDLFTPYFIIRDIRTVEIKGKTANHLVNYVFMAKK